MRQKYLLHLLSVYEIKCLGETFKQLYFFEILCTDSFADSTELESVVWINFSENCFDFPKYFLNFRFDTLEKQSIIHLGRNRRKSYASVVLGDSNFLREGEGAAFCSSFYCIFFMYGVAKSKKSSNFLVFHTSERILSWPAIFLLLIFASTPSSFSWVNCPSLISDCLLIIFVIDLLVTLGEFPSRFLKCSVLLTLFPCYLSIRLFCYVLLAPICCSKIVFLPCHLIVGMSSCILPQRFFFFRYFGMSCFVWIVLSRLNIF